jgi:hypothetical protein
MGGRVTVVVGERRRRLRDFVDRRGWVAYSTVTVFARLRGWSTFSPLARAIE